MLELTFLNTANQGDELTGLHSQVPGNDLQSGRASPQSVCPGTCGHTWAFILGGPAVCRPDLSSLLPHGAHAGRSRRAALGGLPGASPPASVSGSVDGVTSRWWGDCSSPPSVGGGGRLPGAAVHHHTAPCSLGNVGCSGASWGRAPADCFFPLKAWSHPSSAPHGGSSPAWVPLVVLSPVTGNRLP